MRTELIGQLVLLRSFKERVRLIFLGASVSAFMVFMLFEMAKWRPHGIAEYTVHIIGVETFTTFAVFGGLAFLWGLFAPRWLEGFLARGSRRVIRIVGVVGFASVCSVIFYLILR